jgi:hypothetical protein
VSVGVQRNASHSHLKVLTREVDLVSVTLYTGDMSMPGSVQVLRYTSAQLIEMAHADGYDWLTPGNFRQFVLKQWMPPTGKKVGRERLWTEDDARRLLDLCFLHQMNRTGSAILLGLWLHGHPIEQARDLLIRQIEQIQHSLTGLSGSEPLSDDEMDSATERVRVVLEESRVLADLAHAEYPNFPSHHWEELEEQLGISADILRDFSYPYLDPSNPTRLRHGRPQIPPDKQHQLELWYALTRAHDLLGFLSIEDLEQPRWSLPRLVNLLRHASPQELEAARFSASTGVLFLLDDFSVMPLRGERHGPFDVGALLAQYRHSPRHLIGSPPLFPLGALLIASSLHDHSSKQRVTFNLNLLGIAMKHLLQRPDELVRKRDAVLTLLFAFDPRYEPDPRATEALKRHMKELRKDLEQRQAAVMSPARGHETDAGAT